MHVGRTVAQRLRDDLVHDLHDRRVGIDDRLGRLHRIEQDVARAERLDVGAHRRQRGIRLVDAVAQQRGRPEGEPDFGDGERAQYGEQAGVERIGHGDRQRAVVDQQRQHVVAVRVGGIEQRGRGLLGPDVAQVDDRNMQLLAQRTGHVALADEPTLDQQHPEALTVLGLGGILDCLAGDDAGLHEQVAHADARLRHRQVRDQLCGRLRGDGFARARRPFHAAWPRTRVACAFCAALRVPAQFIRATTPKPSRGTPPRLPRVVTLLA